MESGEPHDPTDIIRAVGRWRMFDAGDCVLVAVSGGADSVALMHVLHTHSRELGISLHVAHLNHGLRGEESDIDEEFVRDLAQALGLPITVGRADVPAMRKELRLGEEEAARVARHRFLRETAQALRADKIAIAHTADDRAETILLNILRGCGIDGLGAMRPVDGVIVRPLIETSRTQIEAYLAEHGLRYRLDRTNLDTTYARNRVRHELIPLLEREFNADVKGALVRVGKIAAAQADLMKDLTQSCIHALAQREGLDAGLFADLPLALQLETVRSEVARLKGDPTDVTFEQVQRIVDALKCRKEFTYTLPSGRMYASHKGGILRFFRRPETVHIQPFCYELQVPGETHVPEVRLRLRSSVVDKPNMRKLPAGEALIDAEAVVGKLRVRSVRPGDRIAPLGTIGTKKLQDVFVDKKLPRQDRARAAVVADDEKVLWVVGVVSSETGKVTESTKKAIYVIAESY